MVQNLPKIRNLSSFLETNSFAMRSTLNLSVRANTSAGRNSISGQNFRLGILACFSGRNFRLVSFRPEFQAGIFQAGIPSRNFSGQNSKPKL